MSNRVAQILCSRGIADDEKGADCDCSTVATIPFAPAIEAIDNKLRNVVLPNSVTPVLSAHARHHKAS